MLKCQHQWKMTNIEYGFVIFEKSFNCNAIRSYFSLEDFPALGDEYREGNCFWNNVEIGQSFQFDLYCTACNHKEGFRELMGIMDVIECPKESKLLEIKNKYEKQMTWIMIAFGFMNEEGIKPISDEKLAILSDFFNQNRDTTRSKVKFLSAHIFDDISRCKGEFLYDIGMLSQEKLDNTKNSIF